MKTSIKNLSLLFLLSCISYPLYAAGNAAATCSDAANAMMAGATVKTGGPLARGSSTGGDIKWSTPEGHQGICRVDKQGRVYEVRITQFPRQVEQEYTLSCASKSFRRQECALRGAGTARLERQTSKSKCTEGGTWGVRDSTLWVDKGCAGRFRISPLPSWSPYTVRCESRANSRTNCRIEAQAVVRLYRQSSKAPCQQGYSWGQSGQNLWVDKGCRGVFDISPWSSQVPGFDTSREQARQACTREARKHQFSVLNTRIIETGHRHFDVELETKRDRVEMDLMCRYDVNAGTARLYSY